MLKSYRIVLVLLAVGFFIVGITEARERVEHTQPYQSLSAQAVNELRAHKVGNLWLSVTNYGILGSEMRGLRDPCTNQPAPSAQFPAGSGIEYLFQGAIWVGATVGESDSLDTLVSVGTDGWEFVNEMLGAAPFQSRTNHISGIQQGNCFIPYSPSAISEQDFIGTYTDSCFDPDLCDIDPWDGANSKPLGIRITQRSYSWSQDFAKDFVLFDFMLKNVSSRKLNRAYVGFLIDADCHNPDKDPLGFLDDLSGFKRTAPSSVIPQFEDTINLAWAADNDGISNCNFCEDRTQGVFGHELSPTGIAGLSLLRPAGSMNLSFNWWNSSFYTSQDWGPWTKLNYDRWYPPPFGPVFGTPQGDRAKYFVMSNGEIDYDQLFTALPIWADSGWVSAPPGLAEDLAEGNDTKHLLSFGPVDLNPGDSFPFTMVYTAGENFHVRPTDWDIVDGRFSDINAVLRYYNLLGFSDIAQNALWAGWIYDNPGEDTDGDGYKGKYRIVGSDTIYYQGDGIPDFKGPQPPPAPKLTFRYLPGKMFLKWNGQKTETSRDIFSRERDFEGYRIYLSRSGRPEDLTLIDTYDKIDYEMFIYNLSSQKWELKIASLTADSIIKLFEKDNNCCFKDLLGNCVCLDTTVCVNPEPFGSDPEYWTLANPYVFKGACNDELIISPQAKLQRGDKIAFSPQDYNWGLLDIKAHKQLIQAGQITPQDSEYYEYEYVIKGVEFRQPPLMAVTAFDYGYPVMGVAPLENDPLKDALPACQALKGDLNFSGRVSLADVVELANYLFARDRFSCLRNLDGNCWESQLFCSADVNGSGQISVEDVVSLVNLLFKSD